MCVVVFCLFVLWCGWLVVLFLGMKCSACGILWTDRFEYPALLRLVLGLNRLSPANSAVDCLVLVWMLVLPALQSSEVSSHKLREKTY